MKIINQLYLLSFSLLLTGAACATKMGTPTWTIEEQAMGEALIIAASNGNIARIEEILAPNSWLVNFKDKDGWTALMAAAHRGHTAIVHKLIAAGAQVNTQDNDGYTALMNAARWGNAETVQTLLAARALSTIPDNDGKTALDLAQEKNRINIVELLQNHVDTEPEEETLMVKPAVDYIVKEQQT